MSMMQGGLGGEHKRSVVAGSMCVEYSVPLVCVAFFVLHQLSCPAIDF